MKLGGHLRGIIKVTVSLVAAFAVMLLLGACSDDTGEETKTTINFHIDEDVYAVDVDLIDGVPDIADFPETEKIGYTFDGWYLDADFEEAYYQDVNSSVKDLYAKYTVNKYRLNIYDGDNLSQLTVAYGAPIKSLTGTREGWVFEGFYTDKELTIKSDLTVMPANGVTLYAKWCEGFKATFISNIKGAVTFEGEVEQIVSDTQKDITPVSFTSNFGYEYLYYEIDGVRYYDNEIALGTIEKDTVVTVYSDYATHELPIITIDTDGAEINSKVDYTDMVFNLLNADDELSEIVGGIRLRGNTTKNFPKKPYRIKFDKKQSLFGLEKAKSWVLLAEYIDPSAMHNYSAFYLSEESDGISFTPSPHKVNVYLNGEFQGLYTLCEQVQENEGRMDIEKDVTADMSELKDFNFFICMDKSVKGDIDSVLGETYFYVEKYDLYFELKYPEKPDFASEEQFEKFFEDLQEYVVHILDMFEEGDREGILAEVNINSLIDYLIIDQIMGEMDHAGKSFNMYYTSNSDDPNENGKLSFGPIWDYDWSLYTPFTGEPNVYYTIAKNKMVFSNIFFKAVAEDSELYEMVKVRYNEKFDGAIAELIEEIKSITAGMEQSLELNAQKWYSDLPNVTEDNIKFLIDFLTYREELLSDKWKIEN